MALVKMTQGKGYGQLELNQVAFRRDGRIIAQYKLDNTKTGDEYVMPYVENGMLLAVDHVNKMIKYPENGQKAGLALNYTTEHMYDERLVYGLKHFKLDNGSILPRLGYLAEGDRYTTNTVCYETTVFADVAAIKDAVKAGKVYGVACADEGAKGYVKLVKDENEVPAAAVLQAIEYTTMPDGSDAIKFVAM